MPNEQIDRYTSGAFSAAEALAGPLGYLLAFLVAFIILSLSTAIWSLWKRDRENQNLLMALTRDATAAVSLSSASNTTVGTRLDEQGRNISQIRESLIRLEAAVRRRNPDEPN